MFCLLQRSSMRERRTFQLLVLPCQWGDGGCKEAEVGQNQDSWPKMSKGISYTIWHSSDNKTGVRKLEGKDVWSVCLLKKSLHVMSRAILEMAEHLPDDGKNWMNSLFCFVFMHNFFLYLLICLYCNSWVLELLPFWFSPSLHCRDWVSCVVLSCLPGLNHSSSAPNRGLEEFEIMTDLTGVWSVLHQMHSCYTLQLLIGMLPQFSWVLLALLYFGVYYLLVDAFALSSLSTFYFPLSPLLRKQTNNNSNNNSNSNKTKQNKTKKPGGF